MSGDGRDRPDLHLLPIVGWFFFVVAVCTLLATIAKGGLAQLLASAAALSGGLAFVAYQQGAGWRRTFCTTAAIAAICVAVVITGVSGVWANTPESPPQSTPSIPASRSSAPIAATAKTTRDAPALPPRPSVETEIVYGSTAEFFESALIIGGEGAQGSVSVFNLTTHEIDCPKVSFSVGEEKIIWASVAMVTISSGSLS